jgi:plasmid stabilization system protein ParE
MPITERPATREDMEDCLAIEPLADIPALGVSQVRVEDWRRLVDHPFFISAVFEANPAIRSHKLIGFGAAVIVNSKFADQEATDPRPNIASRIFDGFHAESSVLATRDEIASANAGDGVDIIIIGNAWRDNILNPAQRYELDVLSVSGFVEHLAGFRIRRILSEKTNGPAAEFTRRSAEFQLLAEFPEIGHVIHQMTRESAAALPGSAGNMIFRYQPPVLRLRDSDQELLLAALKGATDSELALALRIKPSAVKARWRSTFARIAEVMPEVASDAEVRDVRGSQKRHRVLSYVRGHREELRPYDWTAKTRAKSTEFR